MVRAGRAHGAAPPACRAGRRWPWSSRLRCSWPRGSSRRRRPIRWSARARTPYKATERYNKEFGDEAVVVLVKGELDRLVLTENRNRIAQPRGLPRRAAAGPEARRWPWPPEARALPRAGEAQAVQDRRRAGHVRADGDQGRRGLDRRRTQGGPASRPRPNRKLAEQLSKRRGDSRGRAEAPRRGAAQQTVQRVPARARGPGGALQHHVARRSRPSSSPRWCSTRGPAAGHAQGALRRTSSRRPTRRSISMPLRHDLTEAERSRAIELIEQATRDPRVPARRRAATWCPACRSSSTAWPTRCRTRSSCCWSPRCS